VNALVEKRSCSGHRVGDPSLTPKRSSEAGSPPAILSRGRNPPHRCKAGRSRIQLAEVALGSTRAILGWHGTGIRSHEPGRKIHGYHETSGAPEHMSGATLRDSKARRSARPLMPLNFGVTSSRHLQHRRMIPPTDCLSQSAGAQPRVAARPSPVSRGLRSSSSVTITVLFNARRSAILTS
jgi:hypothetical protein